MKQFQGKKRWEEIAKLFPHRSPQAIECHGITLARHIRLKSQKYNLQPSFSASANVSALEQSEMAMELSAIDDSDSENDELTHQNAQLDSSMNASFLSHNNQNHTGATAALVAAPLDETIDLFRKVKSIKKSRSKTWSAAEDEALKNAMLQINGNHWSKVAQLIPGKTPQQCLGRWRTLNPNITHTPWTEEEDEILRNAVQRYSGEGKVRWSKVALLLPGRRDTQCRSRWCYSLNPELNLSPWTDEEMKAFVLAKHELGNRWAEIEKRIPGRSVNNLLSRWHSTKRRLEGFLLLKMGTTKEQLTRDLEGYDFGMFDISFFFLLIFNV